MGITLNIKISIVATAVALTLTGAAQAATNASSMQALQSVMSVDIPNEFWVNDNLWDGVEDYVADINVDGNRTSFTGNPWVAGDEALACDTWAGVLCVNGDITHLEIPFSEMSGDMPQLMAALSPIKSTLLSLNLVGNKNLRGTATGLEELQSLEGLFLDNSGLSGELPDLSGMSNLRYAGLNDNPDLTGIAGGIGGSSLEVLNLNNNVNLYADLTSILETSKNSLKRLNIANSSVSGQIPDYSANTNLQFLVIAGSGVGGELNLPNSGQIAAENVDTAGTGVTAGSGTDGLTITPSIAAVTNVSAAADGANAMLVSWDAVSDAEGYIVAYSNDDGANWQSEMLSDGTTNMTNVSSLAAGTYLVSVTAYLTNDAGVTVESTPTLAANPVVISDAVIDGGGDDADTGTRSSGGGGAAFWLILLPMLGFARRLKLRL